MSIYKDSILTVIEKILEIRVSAGEMPCSLMLATLGPNGTKIIGFEHVPPAPMSRRLMLQTVLREYKAEAYVIFAEAWATTMGPTESTRQSIFMALSRGKDGYKYSNMWTISADEATPLDDVDANMMHGALENLFDETPELPTILGPAPENIIPEYHN